MNPVLTRVDRAIKAVCVALSERTVTIADWHSMEEGDLAFHLCYCILGSQVTYESAIKAATRLQDIGVVRQAQVGPWGEKLRYKIEVALRGHHDDQGRYFPGHR